jgi:PBP1b-binding outer membrane lipoprotein LpoB
MKKRILCSLLAIMLLSGCVNNNQGGETVKKENLALSEIFSKFAVM